MTETINVTLCESCLLADAGVPDLVSDDPATPLSKLDGYLIGTLEPEYDGQDSPSYQQHFGHECDGCTTVLSGSRYTYQIVPMEHVVGGCGVEKCARCLPLYRVNDDGTQTKMLGTSGVEYEIQGDYGYGWEAVAVEDTLDDARVTARLYRENETKYAFRIRRVKIES